MTNNDYICARCAKDNPTCCRLSPGNEEYCFPLSVLERNRIREVIPGRGGFILEANSEAFIASLSRLFPRERELLTKVFPLGKSHMRLPTLPDGSCIFLTPTGCALPAETRPFYCRIYPFWVMGDMVNIFACNDCLAWKEGRSTIRMLRMFGLTEGQVKETFGRLRLAFGLPPKEGLPLVDNAMNFL